MTPSPALDPPSAAAAFARDGFACPITVMSADEAGGYFRALEDAKARFGDRAEFQNGLRRYPNLLLPFIDEITRKPAITDVIAEILGPDLLVLDAPFFIKEPHTASYVSWHQDLRYWGLDSDAVVSAWVAAMSGKVMMLEGHRSGVEVETNTARFGMDDVPGNFWVCAGVAAACAGVLQRNFSA